MKSIGIKLFVIIFLIIAFIAYGFSKETRDGQVGVSPTPDSSLVEDKKPDTLSIKIFLIALEDNGKSGKKIGCGDSVVAVSQQIESTNEPLKAAYEKLLSDKSHLTGDGPTMGLYNALYQSKLQLSSLTIQKGKATVNLTGEVRLGGVCDSPRFEAQIKETALQFDSVNEVEIFVNGRPLGEVISGY